MQRYFISEQEFNNRTITSDDCHHIKNVMRMKINDEIIVVYNKSYLARIIKIDNYVQFEITSNLNNETEFDFDVTIIQGYPKGDKMDEIIKNNTQLGATNFIIAMMDRTIVKLDESKKEAKLLRFNKIAKEASEQSCRIKKSNVLEITKLDKIDFSIYNHKILAYEEEASKGNYNLKKIIKSIKKDDKVCIVIGPEGGISNKEVDYLIDKGFIKCSLGPRILRSEMAANYFLSAISYEREL